MSLHVETHEESTEITYFIIILNLVNGYIFDFQIGNQNMEELKPPLIPTFILRSSGRFSFYDHLHHKQQK